MEPGYNCTKLPDGGIPAERGVSPCRQGTPYLGTGCGQSYGTGFQPLLLELLQEYSHILKGQVGVDHDQVGLCVVHHPEGRQAARCRADNPHRRQGLERSSQ
jgi:hypothetical protein